MLQLRSRLNVADNSGAKEAWAIGVLGIRKDNASVGDIIKAHVREAAPDGNVKKGEVVNAVVVRTKAPIRRADGSVLRFDSNAIVIIDPEGNLRWVFTDVESRLKKHAEEVIDKLKGLQA